MPRNALALCCAGLFAWSGLAPAAVITYRGHMVVNDRPYDGQGWFSFAVFDAKGLILWSSGAFPFIGKTNNPPEALPVAVRQGDYAIRLGDTKAGMPPLDLALLQRSETPRLRVWFNDGQRGWQTAGDDIPLANQVVAAGKDGAGTVTMSASQADAIMKELRELRARVDQKPAQQQAAPLPIVTVAAGSSPALGQANAPLVLVEFTDFQCGFCKRFDETVMPGLIKNFVDAGKLRVISRSLPLPFHTNAPAAALAALCANDQQKFWEMREKLFSDAANLTPGAFLRHARELALETNSFVACQAADRHAAQIAADRRDAAAAQITGTPSFVLGKANGTNVTGVLIVGARPYEVFAAEINKLIGTVK